MTNEHTLLSFIARWYIAAREDAATDALGFILNRSEAARNRLTDILREQVPNIVPVATVKNQFSDADGGIPDVACFDVAGRVQALIEAKFSAPLTHHQPNTYWQRLPPDVPTALVFLAPSDRLGHPLGDLTERLQAVGFRMGDQHGATNLITVRDTASLRHLILISWDELLDRLAQPARSGEDSQSQFEIEQLRGVTRREYDETDLRRDRVLQDLIREALNRAARRGWANTENLSSGGHSEFAGRYLLLAGTYAFLGVNRKAWRATDRPLWLIFNRYGGSRERVPTEEVRVKLGGRGNSEWPLYRADDYCVPLEMPPPGANDEERITCLVTQLEEIAQLIDPSGPTYPVLTGAQ